MAVLPHPRDIQIAVVEWLDERFPFTKSVDEAMYQRVPNYANAFYYCFGGMVFILIAFQLLTGVFLAFYYVPDASGNPAPAYNSVQFIMNNVFLGWLMRGIHFWGANLLIVMVALHMARVFWTGSYRAPRELNWMVGVLMLVVILVFSLTGYLLPWDVKAYWASSVTVKVAGSVPTLGPIDIGSFIKALLQGGPVLGPPTLQRFFAIHVFLLPAAILLLMFVHFRLIRQHGISEPL
jgi:menaquinol-cytochrome c reductase cytochrome b subunit